MVRMVYLTSFTFIGSSLQHSLKSKPTFTEILPFIHQIEIHKYGHIRESIVIIVHSHSGERGMSKKVRIKVICNLNTFDQIHIGFGYLGDISIQIPVV